MTTAPQRPYVHSYDPGKDPMELVQTLSGPMERWRADALLVGETSAAIQARHDAVTEITDIEALKRELAAGQAALAIERATFDAEKLTFANQVLAAIDHLTTEWDRFEKAKADAAEEPLATPPGAPSKEPDPSLELEDAEGDLPVKEEDQPEFLNPELPHPPEVEQPPIAAGLDKTT
jgi:hypothetical protein